MVAAAAVRSFREAPEEERVPHERWRAVGRLVAAWQRVPVRVVEQRVVSVAPRERL